VSNEEHDKSSYAIEELIKTP